jgi:RNA polymerase sigma factor (sigma-70 family)
VKRESPCPDAALILQGAWASETVSCDVRKKPGEADPRAHFWEYLGPVNRKVYNFILKSVSSSPDADDVFQESLLKALRYFRTFRKDANFEAWLFSIAHNEVRKYFKKDSRRTITLDAGFATSPDTGRQQDLVREVYRFAETLRPQQREVFFLFYDSGFSVREIAAITGLREGNVRFILHQARCRLRAIMGENNE